MPKRNTYILPLILSCLTIMVAVFLLGELVEKKIFDPNDLQNLRLLYLGRGIAVGAVLTIWSSWFILRYRKKYEEGQKSLQAQLIQSEKLAALGELIGGVAHEINNPIGIILSRIELMLEDAKVDLSRHTLPKDLEVLQKHATRIASISQNLLSFARKSGAEHSEVDLNHVVTTTVPLIDHELKKKGISVECQLANNLPKINGNFNQLQQVVLNLLTNARDALLDGGHARTNPKVWIGTWYRPQENKIRFSVVDNGPLISSEHLNRIFDPFFTTKKNGTGLGLSLSYGIVKEHGGVLTVINGGFQKNCGVCFTVTLPAMN